MRDERPDELLEECGRVARRLGLFLAWTDSLEGEDAKTCSRNGSAAWKNAQSLPDAESAAAGLFKERARARNPAVVASRSNLVLIEFDADLVELCAKFDLWALPGTVRVRSRRGDHLYYRPPAGRTPMKVQVDPSGVTVSEDGYLIAAGALHPTGHVYDYISSNTITVLPVETHDLLRELHDEASAEFHEKIARGEPVKEGARHVVVFRAALRALRQGLSPEQALERALMANEKQCVPPYSERLVRKHWRGALSFAAAHTTEEEKAREAARRMLEERHVAPFRSRSVLAESDSPSIWDQPVPFASRGDMPQFPIETLPGWAAQWATEIAAEKGAALDLSGNLVLAVGSGGIARHVQVSPRPGWYEPTNLYTIVALPPGQRKSPAFKAALRPVRTLEQQLMRAWGEQKALAVISGAIFEKRRKELVGEAAIDDELDPEHLRERMDELLDGLGPTEPPPPPRLLTEDVTPEGLAGLLADSGRVICASDEGGAIFENLSGRYTGGSTSWDVLNKAHSGIDLVVDRKSSGPVIVFDPAVTLAIATQPELLRTLAGKPGAEGRGVLARPLYVLPAPVYVVGSTPAAEPATLDEYTRRVLNLYQDTPQLETDEDDHPRPTLLTFADDARVVFEKFEAQLNRERRALGEEDTDGDSVFLGWLSKLAGQTARLAAILHVSDRWTAGTGTVARVIDEATVARAVELAQYYRLHALAVFGLMGELPEQRRAQRILRWLQNRPAAELETLTVRDVHRSRGKGTTAAQVQTALRLLEQHGYVRIERENTGRRGRPIERVHIHPELRRAQTDPTNPTQILAACTSVGSVGSDPEFSKRGARADSASPDPGSQTT
jgi:hypothetical protein